MYQPGSAFKKLVILFCFFLAYENVLSQTKVLKGKIIDQHNDEPVPFASLQFRSSKVGKQADSSGSFSFRLSERMIDTLEITSVGYQDFFLPVNTDLISGDSLSLVIRMIPGKITGEVVIRKKVNRGLIMWRRIVKNKPFNDRYRFQNFSYELYNKLQLDLKNLNKEKLSQVKMLKPFSFILDNVDTSEGYSALPSYLTEAISDYYYQKSPLRRREVFKGIKTIGIKNESISKLLGGMDQNVNFYNNFIPVFDKQFVSPISDNGDAYYNYKVADTQYVGGKRLIHFLFSPKRKGENTFEGDCWVHDTTFAIQKMNLRLGKEANLNFVSQLSLIQEYQLINDSTWFLSKDKFVVDISPIGKSSISFIGRKTTTYRNVVVNDQSVLDQLAKNRKLEEVILPDTASFKSDDYWKIARHEALSSTEKLIYKTIDTLLSLPAFQRYTKTIDFIGTGYLRVGNYTIGPWQNWVSSNSIEGLRLRFDLSTNSRFDKKITFHGYAAYGFGDRKWKGNFDAFWLPKKDPRMFVFASYLKDFDYGQNYYDEISQDNIFAIAIRKDVPIKFLKVEEYRLEAFKEWRSGFSVLLSGRRRVHEPVLNIPLKEQFITTKGEALNSFETSIRLRYAFLEKFVENHFYRSSLGSPYPIVEAKYTKGFSGVLNSSYDYHKITAGVSNYKKVPPFGSIYWNVFGGRTIGTLPYLYLDIAPGNETYYYNRFAFNMMNRFEFIHDKYAGINFEHNFGNGLFRFIPFTRKLKFRQFWTAKTLWGGLSEKNKQLNFTHGAPFQSLDGKTYLELGTGVDNILKVLRVDLIWRPLPQSRSVVNPQRFGVFGSFRFAF